jgi:hypothetical protein
VIRGNPWALFSLVAGASLALGFLPILVSRESGADAASVTDCSEEREAVAASWRTSFEATTGELAWCTDLLQGASDGRKLWVERALSCERVLADLTEERASLKPAGSAQ